MNAPQDLISGSFDVPVAGAGVTGIAAARASTQPPKKED